MATGVSKGLRWLWLRRRARRNRGVATPLSRLLARGFADARVAQLVSRLLGHSGAINRPGGGGGRWLSGQWRVNHPGVTFLLSNNNLRYHVSIIWKRSPARSHLYSPRRMRGRSYRRAVIAESSRHFPFRRRVFTRDLQTRRFVPHTFCDKSWYSRVWSS